MAFYDDIMSGLGTAGSGLMSGIGAVGDAMQAPRRFLWDRTGKALGGSGTTSGAQLLDETLGIDRNSVLGQGLGFALEEVTDPLTWTPFVAGKIANWLGRGAKVASKFDDAARMAARIPGSASFVPELPGVESQVSRLGQGQRSSIGLQAALPNRASMSRQIENPIEGFTRSPGLAAQIPAFTNVQALDDIQADKIDAMLQRGKNLAPGWAVNFAQPGSSGPAAWLGKSVNTQTRGNLDDLLGRTVQEAINQGSDWQDWGRGTHGIYQSFPEKTFKLDRVPGGAMVFKGATDPSKALVHELGHGITDAGQRLGRINELPYLEQIPARLNDWYQKAETADPGTRGRFYGGLSQVSDELAQHAREGTGGLGMLQEGAKFVVPSPRGGLQNLLDVLSPIRLQGAPPTIRNRYMDIFRNLDPRTADLYRAAGNLPYQIPVAFSAGMGGGELYNQLLGND